MKKRDCDFCGYVTKANLQCTDGRIIKPNAFEHQNGATLPLVWQHQRNSPENVLGNVVLENRPDGVYGYCTFNNTDNAQIAKSLVEHGDITSMSIHANQLVQRGNEVVHGKINEVSLVLAGANPGAIIDNVYVEHGDGDYSVLDDEAIIYTGLALEHSDSDDDLDEEDIQNGGEEEVAIQHEDSGKKEKTVKEIFDSMTEEQKTVCYAMIGYALNNEDDDEAEQSDDDDDSLEHDDEGGNTVKKNVFEGSDTSSNTNTLSHEDQANIIAEARRSGSLKDAVLEHGITQLEVLFPDDHNLTRTPTLVTRDMEWVSKVWNATTKSPFSRIRSTYANLTADEARARGYIKGKKKVEEQFGLLRRSTTPQTVYKKQSLDRDDIIDITDFDVVAWLKSEMRMMLNEELARAILVGDGREKTSDDKISEDHIRSIYHDANTYTIHYTVPEAKTATGMDYSNAIVDGARRARKDYRGSGSLTFFTSVDTLNDLLLSRDKEGRRIYNTIAELASAMGVSEIVEVPVMAGQKRKVKEDGTEDAEEGTKTLELLGIMVNLRDYVIGADKGGAVSLFDDFDIDYNKEKYLIETRCSGALRDPYTAIVLEKEASGE